MTHVELNKTLRCFYAKARNKNEKEYSRSSLLAFPNAIETHSNSIGCCSLNSWTVHHKEWNFLVPPVHLDSKPL